MAITPAVGPSPTMRTNSNAHTSSGTLRSSTSKARTQWRRAAASGDTLPLPMREIDKRSVTSRVKGMAPSMASAMPAVAMAMVSQLDTATSCKNSSECAGGTKLAMNCQVAARLCASHKIQGLNSACTSIGHSTMRMIAAPFRRPRQAGSRGMAVLFSKGASRRPDWLRRPRTAAQDRPCCGTARRSSHR